MPRRCCGASSSRAATPARDGASSHPPGLPHIDDGFCTFNDLHAMLAFVGARDWDLAQRLRVRARAAPARAHAPRRDDAAASALPACRALIAFGRGDYIARDRPARRPAGAGASHRRQPRAARCAASHAAASGRARPSADRPSAHCGLEVTHVGAGAVRSGAGTDTLLVDVEGSVIEVLRYVSPIDACRRRDRHFETIVGSTKNHCT